MSKTELMKLYEYLQGADKRCEDLEITLCELATAAVPDSEFFSCVHGEWCRMYSHRTEIVSMKIDVLIAAIDAIE